MIKIFMHHSNRLNAVIIYLNGCNVADFDEHRTTRMCFFFVVAAFVLQCAFKLPVKMTANESEMCVFVSDCM